MTGCDRVLNLLADREWHSSHELQHDLEVMAHSRIAELRARGHVIEHRQVPGQGLRAHEYRLLSPLEEGPSQTDQPVPDGTGQRVADGVYSSGPSSNETLSARREPQDGSLADATSDHGPTTNAHEAGPSRALSVFDVIFLLGRHGFTEIDSGEQLGLFNTPEPGRTERTRA